MKKIILIGLVAISVLFQGCSVGNNNVYPWFMYGTLYKTGSNFYLLGDDNSKYLIKQTVPSENLVDSRCYIEGNIADNNVDGFAYVINVFRFESVLVGELEAVNSMDEVNALGKDYLFIKRMSNNVIQGGKFLNIFIEYTANKPELHSFKYAYIPSEIVHNKAKVYVCHNKNGDSDDKAQAQIKYTSLDLSVLFDKIYNNEIELEIIFNGYTIKHTVYKP